ncbi:MAG: hypothetical protein QF464_01880 [Myxococcota bacterium]|nr:hypothetical protein [Myxococcota bacterium]
MDGLLSGFSVEKFMVGAVSPGANIGYAFDAYKAEGPGFGVLFWGLMVVLSIFVLGFLIKIVSGWATEWSFYGSDGFRRKNRLVGGNFRTAGNSPLWEGGSLSGQANLAVAPKYADSALVGKTGWAAPGPRGVSCPSPPVTAMSDAALAALAQ